LISSETSPRHFPPLQTRNLDGQAVMLPDDLPGPWDVLVLAFRRRQQDDVEAWRAAIEAAGIAGLGFWEVPVIGRGWGPLRGWIDGGMAGAIPQPRIRAHTLTAYTDVAGVRRALGIADSGQVVAVLVADGTVRWQAAGRPDPRHITSLRSAFDGSDPG
jgi:hypothetical protein